MNEIELAAKNLASCLRHQDLRIVLAESCTAGLISASLGLVPGISGHLCGSAVVYREQTKVDWLRVRQSTLDENSAESGPTTTEIARGVLELTSEADIALGITGHFGPNAPENLDGVVFVAVYQRKANELGSLGEQRFQLQTKARADRQREAATLALQFFADILGERGE